MGVEHCEFAVLVGEGALHRAPSRTSSGTSTEA
jgi:hypothetical protein